MGISSACRERLAMSYMQKLEGLIRNASQMYSMIGDGDKICVAVSGGKDSVALAIALNKLKEYHDKSFSVCALSLDPCFGGNETDYTALEMCFKNEGIEYHIERSRIGTIIFETRNEKNPCALCAKMRRGILHRKSVELGCNKIALGHHMDDAVETFYMNLFNGAEIKCFSPVTWLSCRKLTLIRPMILADEKLVAKAAAQYPVVKSGCPVDGNTERARIKLFVGDMLAKDPAFCDKTVRAMQKSGINGWAANPPKGK